MNASPPEGFSISSRGSPVTAPWEPIYTRELPESVELGLFVRDAHHNSRGFLHGGVLAALCDVAMGYTLGKVLRNAGSNAASLLTTNLSVDYLDKADGGWLSIVPRVIHAGRSSGVVEASAYCEHRLIAHAKAAFRMGFPAK